MKNVKTNSIKLPNGHLIIGVNGKNEYRTFFIQTTDGIFQYNEDEMQEVYGVVPCDTDEIGKE